ncbi:MAG: FAD-dependent oxidoreductase [Clostridia bacterium]|nr:FAD-dependent oxidoreductase [Clostridia bacterium]
MNDQLSKKILNCDLCVIGGGLAGCFAALSAARHGTRVVLMQDRPMLGGNASSEIRMWVRGARGKFNRESGLISELEERNIHNNPTLVHSLFDATLYGMLEENENITLLLNTSCLDAETRDGRILSVTGWQLTTYTYVTVQADIFMDCSGDSILAPLVGAEYRHGREGTQEFGESLAQPIEDTRTMGLSVILAARETDHPVPFTPPAFANKYPTDESFSGDVRDSVHTLPRSHDVKGGSDNLWWVELGGEGDSIHDSERVRRELLASIYGVWDHLKNHGDHGMECWDLEWVGFLPGKRESRRYVGDHILTEADVLSGGDFADEVAYGGWPLDDHNPYGMRRNEQANFATHSINLKMPYGIPLRCLYSKNVENLMFAGRNISVTHVALSSSRVMATCSLLGQAAGTAASVALRYGLSPRDAAREHIKEIQKILLDDGVFLLHTKREATELTRNARLNLSDAERDALLNGWERPRTGEMENGVCMPLGEGLTFSFDCPVSIGGLRLRFDPDYGRTSVTSHRELSDFAMILHRGKDFVPVKVPATIVKSFSVYADGQEVASVTDNFRSLVTLPLAVTAKEIRIVWHETNGAPDVHLFAADLLP